MAGRFAGEGIVDVSELAKAVAAYKKALCETKTKPNKTDTNACGCSNAEKYACRPDECEKCSYAGCYTDRDNSYTGCAAYITMPDEISDALDAIANHFLGTDDYYVDFNDDGSITIAYCDDDDTEVF